MMNFFKILFPIIIIGCSSPGKKQVIPNFIKEENITIYSLNSEADTVLFVKDKEFGDTNEIFYASMGEFTIDDSGRVYIADAGWGSRSLHVYNPNGSYLKKIAGEGKGPAEFLDMSDLQYQSNTIFFYDSELYRLNYFNTNSVEYTGSASVNPQKWQHIAEISTKRPQEFFIQPGNNIIASFEEPIRIENSENPSKIYFRLDADFNVISENLVKLKAKKFIHATKTRTLGTVILRSMKHFPFFERHFFIPTNNGYFYTVDSKYFLIKKYDDKGNFISGFYYPYKAPEVTRDDALKNTSESIEDIARNVELPERWPAINSIFFDDENRFWISTFTESDEYFQWWVLKESGELLAKFRLPGDRYAHPDNPQNHIIIKDGYFYKKEKDTETGEETIVRYKINFKKKLI